MTGIQQDKQFIVWFGINGSGKVRMFLDEPVRDDDLKIWVGKNFCNSVIQKQLETMVKGTTLSWESDAQVIQLS